MRSLLPKEVQMAHLAVHEADCCRADENPQKAVGGSARVRHRVARHGCASLTRSPRRQRSGAGPNAEPRGSSQRSSDARGGSSRDFTEDGRTA